MALRRVLGAALALAATLALAAWSRPPSATGATTAAGWAPSLRSLAVDDGISVGAAVDVSALTAQPDYARLLADQYDMVTPENVMKWVYTEPRSGSFRFGPADRLVDFARRHGMAVRGHNLVWFEQNPPWLYHLGPADLRRALRRHIQVEVGHFRGRIRQWDVVNEAVADSGTLRPDLWWRALGPGYIAAAFRWAHAADPGAKLFYNDYGIEAPGPKSTAVLDLLVSLRRAGVPVDGVGLQLHVVDAAAFDPAALARQVAAFAAAGLQVAVTEMDVRLRPPVGAGQLRRQAADYAAALLVCRADPACRTFVTWGFTDRDSWIPATFPGSGQALPFDARLAPKPAAYALRSALAAPLHPEAGLNRPAAQP